MEAVEEIAWCENLWNSLHHGATWGIPRTGLMFRKESTRNALVLYMRMPYVEGMPGTEEELRERQDGELLAVRERFTLLGIEVLDET